MNIIRDQAYKLGCGRLLFEHGAIAKLGDEAKRLGNRPLVICGKNAHEALGSRIRSILESAGLPCQMSVCTEACSEEIARTYAQRMQDEGLDLIIGVGGGRIMDLAKIIADIAGVPVATVPAISATCAAYTPLSVVYTPDGCCRGTWYFQWEVALVVCDLDILCTQHPRYLAAGMVDAIAKHVEIKHHLSSLPAGRQDVLIAQQLARTIYDDLFALGAAAGENLHSDAAVRCIFHAIVTTGLVSGIARGMYQSAIGHAFYEVIRSLYPQESKPWLHGEVVGVGLRLQELYGGYTEEEAQLAALMARLNMPLTLMEIAVPADEDAPARIAGHSPLPSFFLHPDEDEARVCQILRTIR